MKKKTIKQQLQYGLLYKDIRKSYMIIVGLLTIILSIGYISYANFTVKKEKKNSISIITGNLIYNLSGEGINNNKIELEPSEIRKIEVTIDSLNSIESMYQLYYKENSNIEISYVEGTNNPYQEQVGVHPGDDYQRKTTIVIRNKSDNKQTVEIGAQGGLIDKELTLETGRTKIEKIAAFTIGADKEVTVTEKGNVGSKITFTVTDKEGYQYNGAEILNSKNEVIEVINKSKKELTMPAEDIYIRVLWIEKEYTITNKEVMGGTITISDKSTYNATVTFTTAPTIGYQYNGATITNASGTTVTTLNASTKSFTMPASNVTITPKWSKISYTISTGTATGGTITLGIAKGEVGDKITFTTTQDTGYQYAGATVTYGSSTINVASTTKEFVMPASNVTVTPKFTKINYTISTTSVTGGSITVGNSATMGSTVSFSTTPSTGYSYGGATIVDTSGTTLLTLNSSTKTFTMPASNITVTPKWIANTYTISYNANGGSGTIATHTVTYNQPATISTNKFTRTGYTFAGWTTNANGTSDNYNWQAGWSGTWKYVDGQYGITNGKLILYAMWTQTAFSITNSSTTGGSISVASTATSGTTITFTTTPNDDFTYYGATIKNSSGTTIATLNSSQKSFTMPASNVTVKPKWKKNDFNIIAAENSSDSLESWQNFTNRDSCCGTFTISTLSAYHYLQFRLTTNISARQQWTNGRLYDLTHYQTAVFAFSEFNVSIGSTAATSVYGCGAFFSQVEHNQLTGTNHPWAHEMTPHICSYSFQGTQNTPIMYMDISELQGRYYPYFELLNAGAKFFQFFLK